uniref:Pepco domain-containing protein n=1 Tax=Marinobacterium profundum TaxID=1714300 RepID=UPI0008301489|nr:hypothetical protein [Marinobacterium profundum]
MSEKKLVIFDITDVQTIDGIRPTRARGDRVSASAQAVEAVEASSSAIEKSLTGFIDTVKSMLEKVDDVSGNYKINKVEIAAQVSSEGKVGFMGVGLSANASSSMKIEFTRRD